MRRSPSCAASWHSQPSSSRDRPRHQHHLSPDVARARPCCGGVARRFAGRVHLDDRRHRLRGSNGTGDPSRRPSAEPARRGFCEGSRRRLREPSSALRSACRGGRRPHRRRTSPRRSHRRSSRCPDRRDHEGTQGDSGDAQCPPLRGMRRCLGQSLVGIPGRAWRDPPLTGGPALAEGGASSVMPEPRSPTEMSAARAGPDNKDGIAACVSRYVVLQATQRRTRMHKP